MFKHLPLKNITLVTALVLMSLFSSLTSIDAFSAEMTFQLAKGLNGISIPFENSGISDAERLSQSIQNCESVSYWDAVTQKFVTHTSGSADTIFPLVIGYPYFVSVTKEGSWVASGTLPDQIIFNLTTTATTSVNTVSLPVNMSNIITAEDLVSVIPNADTIWYLDQTTKRFVGHPKGAPINNFSVFAGLPYFVNVTANAVWTVDVALKGKITATPTIGYTPLSVLFGATAKGGTPPYSYLWELIGDGTSYDSRQTFSYIYQQPGTYRPSLTVNDTAGNTASDSTTVTASTLNRNPVANASGPYSGRIGQLILFDGSGSSDPDGDALTYAWQFGDGSTGSGVKPTHSYSGPGTFTLTLTVSDGKGGTGTAQTTAIVAISAPSISGFNLIQGPVGTVVTVSGANFDTGGLKVAFNGIPAVISSFNGSSITTSVPLGATTGPITVTTDGGTATSASAFNITSFYDFNLSVTPRQVTAAPGGQVTYTISATGAGSFSNLISLDVSGLPAGFSGSFSPKTITAGQSSTLVIYASNAGGPVTPVITGSTTISGIGVTKSVSASLIVLSRGATMLVGRVLDTDGIPLNNVTIMTENLSAITDDAGNFILQNPPAGDHVVLIDGSTASTATAHYPTIPITINIVAGQTNTLPYVPHLHAQKNSNFTPIDPTTETKAEDPSLPGLQLRIPAGVNIIGWDGEANTKVSMRQVPIDALPVPPPPPEAQGRSVYMFYFGKMGGGVPTVPIPVTVPNDLGLKPGEKADLWYFNESPNIGEAPNAWSMAGTGTVSDDGMTISTDPGVGIPRFCCGAIFVAPEIPTGPNIPPDPCKIGQNSVDPSTGVFVHSETDLVIPGTIPIEVTRTYRSLDTFRGPYGVGTYFAYDWYMLGSGGDMVTLVRPPGTRISFSRQPDGSFININEPLYRGAKVFFNSDRTRTLRMKDGTTYRFEAAGGLLDLITDRNGNELAFIRNGEYNVTTILGMDGRFVYFDINARSNELITRMTDTSDRTTTYAYDYPTARLMSVTNPEGGVTRYGYDSQGRMNSITDPLGNTKVKVLYDANGRACQEQYADGGAYTFYYVTADQATTPEAMRLLAEAAAGGPISAPACSAAISGASIAYTVAVDPNGNPTTYRFNGAQKVIAVIDSSGQPTSTNRDPVTNLVTSRTDALGRTTAYTYDNNGNVTSTTDPAGNVTSMEYDPVFSRPTKITDALGNVTSMVYDSKGNPIRVTDPSGNLTTIAYNQDGQPVSVTDAMGNTATLEYDYSGNLIKTTDPLGSSPTRQYDDLSRLIQSSDARGRITAYTYDLMNRMTEVKDPLNGSTKFTYDLNGNLLSVTDAKGQTTGYSYNSKNKMITMMDSLGRTEAYVYDVWDNLIRMTDRKGQATTYAYDNRNRVKRMNYADGSYIQNSYDAVGRLVGMYDSASGSIEYQYADIGAGCTTGCGGKATDKIVRETTPLGSISYTYDALGRRSRMTVAGQPAVNYHYDARSQLTEIDSIINGAVSGFTIQYDALGRRTSLTYPNRVTTNYTYDNGSNVLNLQHLNPLNQIVESLTYTYDGNGNRMTTDRLSAPVRLPNPASNGTYNSANQMLTFNDKSMTYDENGNTTSVTDSCGTTIYTWDARDRLVSIQGFSSGCTAVTASFKYDALGRRIEKTINGRTIHYVYDGQDIIQEIEHGGVRVNYLRTLSIDEPLARVESTGITRYYQTDALGSMIALADEGGAIKTRYVYDPFGNVTVTGETSDNAFQYSGRENDGNGLYYYRARYYSPHLQRFISPDPIGLEGGINLFVYAANNPITWIDPLGFASQPDPCHRTKKCVGTARVLKGNSKLVGRQGGFPGVTVAAGSAAVMPAQWWGGSARLRGNADSISGTASGASFNGVTDVIGGDSPIPGTNVRDALQMLNPGTLVLELPSIPKDLGVIPVTLTVPSGMPCPYGTVEQ